MIGTQVAHMACNDVYKDCQVQRKAFTIMTPETRAQVSRRQVRAFTTVMVKYGTGIIIIYLLNRFSVIF